MFSWCFPILLLFSIALALRLPPTKTKCLKTIWLCPFHPSRHWTAAQRSVCLVEGHSHRGGRFFCLARSSLFVSAEVILNMNSFLPAVQGKVFQRLGGNCNYASLHLAWPDVTHFIEHASQEAHVPSDTGKAVGAERLCWGCPDEKSSKSLLNPLWKLWFLTASTMRLFIGLSPSTRSQPVKGLFETQIKAAGHMPPALSWTARKLQRIAGSCLCYSCQVHRPWPSGCEKNYWKVREIITKVPRHSWLG